MARLKTTRPAFLVLDDAVPWRRLSLRAIGLWAHIEAQKDDMLNIPALQAQFPVEDVSSLIAELVAVGVLLDVDKPPEPPIEEPWGRQDDEPHAAIKRPGFVYVIESGGYFKIGTTRNIKERVKQLQTGHFKPLELVWQRRCADPAALELRMHTILQPLREVGEWFSCSREQLDAALRLGVLGHDEVDP